MTQKPPVEPASQEDLDAALRRLARTAHPSPEFTARLRGELNAQPAKPARLRGRWWPRLKPWLGQGAAVALLVGLLLLAGVLTSRLFDPRVPQPAPAVIELTSTPLPAAVNGLPRGALARLGKGQIRSLDAAPDGRVAVGSSAGVCLYGGGVTVLWCRWTASDVVGVLFSPAGDLLAVRYANLIDVEIWDAASGQLRAAQPFANSQNSRMPGEALVFFATSHGMAWEPAGGPDAPRLAVTSRDAQLALWDWSAGALAWGPLTLPEEAAGLGWAAGPNGDSLLAVSTSSTVALYDGLNGEPKSSTTFQADPGSAAAPAMAIAPDGQQVAVATPAGLDLFPLAGWTLGEPRRSPVTEPVEWLAFSPDASRLAASANGQILILDAADGTPQDTLPARQSSPLAWRPTDNALFYTAPNGSLAVFSDENQGEISSGHVNLLQHLAWDGNQTLVSGGGNYLYAWGTATAAATEISWMSSVDLPATPELVGFSTSGLAGYLDRANNTVTPWDIAQNQPMAGVLTENGLLAAAIDPTKRRMAAVSRDGLISIYNILEYGIQQTDLSGIPGLTQVDALALQPGGDLVAVSYAIDGQGPGLEVWNIASGQRVAALPVTANVNRLVWSPDDSRLAALHDLEILVYDTASFTLQQALQLAPAKLLRSDRQPWPFIAAAFSPDGASLAAAGRDILVYDLASGQITHTFSGHNAPVLDLAYRPDGLALASASRDGTILVWDLGASQFATPATPAPPIQPTATPLAPDSYPTNSDPAGSYPAPGSDPTYSYPAPVTQEANPIPSQTPEAVNLAVYDISMQVSQAPSGDWAVQFLRGEWTERAPDRLDYNQFTVYHPDHFILYWRVEEWPAHGLGEGLPVRFTWSADERYFYIDDRWAPDGCGAFGYHNLRRIDLTNGQIEAVRPMGFDLSGIYSLAPGAERLAVVLGAHVETYNMTTGRPEFKFPFEPLSAQTQGPLDAPIWSPDGTRLAFVMAAPYPLCGDTIDETALMLVDLAGIAHRLDMPADTTLTGWRDAATLILVDSRGDEHLFDLQSGQLITDPAASEK